MHLYISEILALKARTLVKVNETRRFKNLRIRNFLLPEGRSLKQRSFLFSHRSEEACTLFYGQW